MIDKNTRNCNLVKRVVNIVVSLIAIIIAQIIADKYFDGRMFFYSDNNGNNFVDFDTCRNCCR